MKDRDFYRGCFGKMMRLDPFNIVPKPADTLNPVDLIETASLDECRAMAKALVRGSPEVRHEQEEGGGYGQPQTAT